MMGARRVCGRLPASSGGGGRKNWDLAPGRPAGEAV